MINIDTVPISQYAEMLHGFIDALQSTRTASQTVNAMGLIAGAQFDLYADAAAKTNPQKYHHVYEWGGVGDPNARLWDIIMTGSGGFRTMFYNFKPSTQPVPRLDDPQDTRMPAVFIWKAPVMERGMPVDIIRKPGTEYLVWPRGNSMSTGAGENPMVFFPGDIVIQHPGGKETKGSFTSLWESYWAVSAEKIIAADVVEVMEKQLGMELTKTVAGLDRTMGQRGAGFAIQGHEWRYKGGKVVNNTVDAITAQARRRRDIISGEVSGI